MASPAASLEEIEARVGGRERRTLVVTVGVTILFVAAAAGLLLISVGEVRKTQSELDESQTLLLARLPHRAQVSSASFHPDAKHVVTASADGVARVWEWQTRRVVARLPQRGPVSSAVFSPDGRLVITANDVGEAMVWDWRNDKVLTTMRLGHPVTRAEFDPTGRLVVTAAGDQARVSDWRAGRVLATLPHSTPVTSAAFGSDGLVVTGSADRARVWDIRPKPPRRLAVLPPPVAGGSEVPIFDAGFGPGGVVITTTTGAATIYDVKGFPEPDLIHAGDVTSAAFSPDGKLILTTSSAGAALLWPRRLNASPLVLRQNDASGLLDAGFSPGGELVVAASSDSNAEVYRPAKPPSDGD